MTRTRTARLALIAVVAVCSALVLPTAHASTAGVMRHLRLVSSFPIKDTTLTSSPDAIRLWLSEPTEAGVSKITLAADGGTAISLAALTREAAKDAPLVAKIPKPLAVGAYTVTWKAMSKDGHVVNGTFGFRVAAPK